MKLKSQSLEEILMLIQQQKGSPSIKKLFEILKEKGPLLVIFFFSLPFCQPFHFPGMSTPFGIVITILAFCLTFRLKIWMPKFFLSREIPASKIQKLTRMSLWLVRKIKPWVHPRLQGICHHPVWMALNGLMLVFLGFFLALPLPIPTTNIGVAWGIFLISLGLLENDGLFVCFGYIASVLYFAFLLVSVFLIKAAIA